MPDKNRKNAENTIEQLDHLQAQADAIKQTSTAAALATCLSKTFGKIVGSNGIKAYVDATLAATGDPKDPIERMLVEQLIVAHHRIIELHAESACADTPQVKDLYNTAALRLMNEYRKASLALREYRTPVVSKSLTLVNQQNVAAGNQQIAYVEGEEPHEKKTSRTELSSKEPKALTHDIPITLNTEPTASRGREAELVQAKRTDTRGATTLAGGCVGQ